MLATDPFAAFHFQRLALSGLPANLVAVPLTSFWILPWAVLAVLLMPFWLAAVALVTLGWGIDLVMLTAATVATWPAAGGQVAPQPALGLGVRVPGGIRNLPLQPPWLVGGL